VGPVEDNVIRLRQHLQRYAPKCFATVGDFVSEQVLKAGIQPDIIVVDHRIMRNPVEPMEFNRDHVEVSNTPGTISAAAQRILYEAAVKCEQLAVIVDGEEDLLVLPLIKYLPDTSVIVYGQPREGMVVVTITREKRVWVERFMSEMHRVASTSGNP